MPAGGFDGSPVDPSCPVCSGDCTHLPQDIPLIGERQLDMSNPSEPAYTVPVTVRDEAGKVRYLAGQKLPLSTAIREGLVEARTKKIEDRAHHLAEDR